MLRAPIQPALAVPISGSKRRYDERVLSVSSMEVLRRLDHLVGHVVVGEGEKEQETRPDESAKMMRGTEGEWGSSSWRGT